MNSNCFCQFSLCLVFVYSYIYNSLHNIHGFFSLLINLLLTFYPYFGIVYSWLINLLANGEAKKMKDEVKIMEASFEYDLGRLFKALGQGASGGGEQDG